MLPYILIILTVNVGRTPTMCYTNVQTECSIATVIQLESSSFQL